MMIRKFISLELKQFIRSPYLQKSIFIKIIFALIGFVLISNAFILGYALFPILSDKFPNRNPLELVNSFFLYWFIGDLMLRFFLQKLPVFSVKPLLSLPIKKSKILHYILFKSAISFFTFLPLFFILPFGFSLIEHGYTDTVAWSWMSFLFISTLISNYLNFIIENKSAESELSFLPLILVSLLIATLNYFNLVPFGEIFSLAINKITEQPIYLIIPILILITLYYFNFSSLKQKLHLDQSLSSHSTSVNTSEMVWLQHLGPIAPFMRLDLRLIARNKRSKSTILLLILGMLYGLIFYPNFQKTGITPMIVFVGIFITGNFMLNFGQFIPAWDSAYFKLLMSQNAKYKDYIQSKYILMVGSSLVMFVFSIPYVYYSWKILLVNFAALIFNIGVNSYVLLYAGSYNRKSIKLDQRASFNYQGTGAVQWLLALPILIIPTLVFYIPFKLVSLNAGVFALIISGLIGIVLHQKIMKLITQKYTRSKYKMIQAFAQE